MTPSAAAVLLCAPSDVLLVVLVAIGGDGWFKRGGRAVEGVFDGVVMFVVCRSAWRICCWVLLLAAAVLDCVAALHKVLILLRCGSFVSHEGFRNSLYSSMRIHTGPLSEESCVFELAVAQLAVAVQRLLNISCKLSAAWCSNGSSSSSGRSVLGSQRAGHSFSSTTVSSSEMF